MRPNPTHPSSRRTSKPGPGASRRLRLTGCALALALMAAAVHATVGACPTWARFAGPAS
jgi:hypothetical protein